MVMTSTGNDTGFDKVATALMEQHAKIHTYEGRTGNDRERKPFEKKSFQKFHKYNRQANLGQHAWLDEHYEQDEEDEDSEEETGYFAGGAEHDEVCDTLEDVEEDTFICMLCDGHEDAEEIASVCHTPS